MAMSTFDDCPVRGSGLPCPIPEQRCDGCPANTYKIRRFYADDTHPDHRKVIETGLTLDEAQEHCNDEDTREYDPETGFVIWFDGYDKEN